MGEQQGPTVYLLVLANRLASLVCIYMQYSTYMHDNTVRQYSVVQRVRLVLLVSAAHTAHTYNSEEAS